MSFTPELSAGRSWSKSLSEASALLQSLLAVRARQAVRAPRARQAVRAPRARQRALAPRRMLWLAFVAPLCVLGSWGCDRSPTPGKAQEHAEFGVFYGGQVQEREEIPFELDRTRQTHGFRVALARPLREATELSWQLSRPRREVERRSKATAPNPNLPGESATVVVLAPGQQHYEKSFHFEPGDPLGLWNIRVTLGAHVLIDRPFLVYNPEERRRRPKADGGR